MVEPSSKPNGLTTVQHFTQRMLFSPVPSTRLAGHAVPQPGHFLSTNGSSPKAALLVTIVPEEVASDSTRIDSMVMASASPTRAPSTATGRVTSCPPRNSGVIMGPQQPGGTTQRMWPPSLIVAANPRLGPISPPVYSSTKTSSLMSLSIVFMRSSAPFAIVEKLKQRCPGHKIRGSIKQPGSWLHFQYNYAMKDMARLAFL